MKLKISLAALLFVNAAFSPWLVAHADEPDALLSKEGVLSGSWLYETCTKVDSTENAMCNAYVSGWVEGALVQSLATSTPYLFCEPKGTSEGQLRDVALHFLAAHPDARQLPASVLLGKAMQESFPCR